MFDLYPHQLDVIDQLAAGAKARHRRQILAMPTGSGKTVVAGELARRATERGKRVLFAVHLRELVLQAVQHFEAIGLRVGVLQGANTDYTDADQVVVASIHTIRSRSAPDWIDLVIVDEVHILYRAHVELMDRWNNLHFIGLSATPLREDLGKHFTNLVRGPSVRWLTEHGFLVPDKTFCPGSEHMTKILEGITCNATPMGYDFNQKQLGKAMNQKELVGDIVKTWQQLGEDRQTLCFAVNKAHSRSIVEDFEVVGVAAAHIEDRTPDAERRDLIARFRTGDIRILSSVGVLGIGFDVPDASCLILARPTKSEALDMQQKGRGIRRAEGKENCIILDHAGNTLLHGRPRHFWVPDLQALDRQRNERKKREAKMVSCSNCGFTLERDQFTCPNCGVDRPRPKSKVTYLDGDLVAYGSLADGTERPTLEQKKEVFRQLLWFAEEHDYKPGWAAHKYRERFKDGWPKRSWNRLNPSPPEPGLLRWIKSQRIRFAKSRDRKK